MEAMNSTSMIILTCILSSSLAATVVTSIKEVVIWFLNRRAKVKDDAHENEEDKLDKVLNKHQDSIDKLSKAVDALDKKLSVIAESYKIILKDKIKYLVFKYIEYGEITLDEKQAIHHMWNMYHFELEGNGDLDEIMELLEDIPLREVNR